MAYWRRCPSRGGWRWLKQGDGCHGGWESAVTAASCAAVGLPPLPGYAWYADAPVYARADFGAFYGRLNWDACEAPAARRQGASVGAACVRHNPKVYDQLAYLCYKVHVGNWSTRSVDFNPESHVGCDERAVQTVWSRSACARTSLRYHLDRALRYGADGTPLRNSLGKHLEAGHAAPPKCAARHDEARAQWVADVWAFIKQNLRDVRLDM